MGEADTIEISIDDEESSVVYWIRQSDLDDVEVTRDRVGNWVADGNPVLRASASREDISKAIREEVVCLTYFLAVLEAYDDGLEPSDRVADKLRELLPGGDPDILDALAKVPGVRDLFE